MSTETNRTKKRNQEVRMEYKPSVIPMFSFSLRHFSNISAHNKQENNETHSTKWTERTWMNRKEGHFVNKPRLFLCAHIKRSKVPRKNREDYGSKQRRMVLVGWDWVRFLAGQNLKANPVSCPLDNRTRISTNNVLKLALQFFLFDKSSFFHFYIFSHVNIHSCNTLLIIKFPIFYIFSSFKK